MADFRTRDLASFNSLPYTVRIELAKFLDFDGSANWEALAEELRCRPDEAGWIRNRARFTSKGSPTLLFFDEYVAPQNIGILPLTYALERIGNITCVQILQKYVDQIQSSNMKYPIPAVEQEEFYSPPPPPPTAPSAPYITPHQFHKLHMTGMPPHEDRLSDVQKIGSVDRSQFTYGMVHNSAEHGRNSNCSPNSQLCEKLKHADLRIPGHSSFVPAYDTDNNNVLDLSIQPSEGLGCSGAIIGSEWQRAPVEKPDIKAEQSKLFMVPYSADCLNTRQNQNIGDKQTYVAKWVEQQGNLHRVDGAPVEPKSEPASLTASVSMRSHSSTGSKSQQSKHITDPLVKRDVDKLQGITAGSGSLPTSSTATDLQHSVYAVDNRQVRVFVTYTSDNKRHMNNVLHLCKCLKKNNFSVGLDVREAHLLREDAETTLWYNMRYDKADYILILVSPLYRRIIEGNAQPVDGDSGLNALYIHQRMFAEYSANNGEQGRFIPVVMPGASSDDIPKWLRNVTSYTWPDQFCNFFYYMMKPAQVITNFVSRCKNPPANPSSAADGRT